MRFDVVIIGSGIAGCNAAASLVEANLKVAMVDIGHKGEGSLQQLPDGNKPSYQNLRQTAALQREIFFGQDLEQLAAIDLATGNKLPPSRAYVLRQQPGVLENICDGFVLNQSFAMGGLAEGWGAGASPLPAQDFAGSGLSREDIDRDYLKAAQRIGISGRQNDDLCKILGTGQWLQPPLDIDTNAEVILSNYQRGHKIFKERKFHMGQSQLAVLTKKLGKRAAHQYYEMDFWRDTDRSLYRPRFTLEYLLAMPNFTYISNAQALHFKSGKQKVELFYRDLVSRSQEKISSRHLILAAGTFGSAKLAIQSLDLPDVKVPVLTNSNTYILALNYSRLFKKPAIIPARRYELSQLGALFSPNGLANRKVFSSFFTYRAMLTTKLLKEAPLPAKLGREILQTLLPYLNIVTMLHDDNIDLEHKYATLSSTNPDAKMNIQYDQPEFIRNEQIELEKGALNCLGKCGLFALKKIHRAPGTSIHYGGTLPMQKKPKGGLCPDLTVDRDHRLRGDKSGNIWVADGASLPMLSACPPSFTHMAFANRVARLIISDLENTMS